MPNPHFVSVLYVFLMGNCIQKLRDKRLLFLFKHITCFSLYTEEIAHWRAESVPITKHELKKLRKSFWKFPKAGNPDVWEALKIEAECQNSRESLVIHRDFKLSQFKMDYSRSLYTCVDGANNIPFYLFHEPKIKPSISQKPQKVKDLVITVRPSDGKDLQVDSLNSQSLIADLTNLISGKFCVNNNDIRIVSKGKILELNKTLRFYEVKNGDLVQAMFTQVPQTQQMTQNQETK